MSCFDVLQIISFDVKPENILLDNTMTIARLTDVGLAKVMLHLYLKDLKALHTLLQRCFLQIR